MSIYAPQNIAGVHRLFHDLPFPGMPGTRLPSSMHCVARGGDLVCIDPFMAPFEKGGGLLGKPTHVVITNENHGRDAAAFRRRYGARIWARRELANAFDFELDCVFSDGARLPGDLRALALPGCFRGESAFLLDDAGGSLVVGDAFMNLDLTRYGLAGAAMRTAGWPQGPGVMPRLLMQDEDEATAAYRRLLRLDFRRILPTHGTPVLSDARAALQAALEDDQTLVPRFARPYLYGLSRSVWERFS